MEIIHHRAAADEMHVVEYFTSQVIVHYFDGRLHVDIKGFPEDFPMTVCVEDLTVFDQDGPQEAEPPHYGMFTDDGNAAVDQAIGRAMEIPWPLTTSMSEVVEWVQEAVESRGEACGTSMTEVHDTACREYIYEALEQRIAVARKDFGL